MADILLEQARFTRDDHAAPRLAARSQGFVDDWLAEAERLVVGFGNKPDGLACPRSVFAQPFGSSHVAVVQVADRGGVRIAFHFLVLDRADYEQFFGDPFQLARRIPANFEASTLEPITAPREPLPARTVADVQRILKRVKAHALAEDQDPTAAEFERTVDNSESPALLGGVQALVEGGKVVFERPGPDTNLIEDLWLLLPHTTRARLWPASFAFGNNLRFDALVVSRAHPEDFEGYTSEEQAADYPAGHYEVALQVAAETNNQRDLDALLNRRSANETFRLGLLLLTVALVLAFAPKIFDLFQTPPARVDPKYKVAAAVGMITTGDPWTALALKMYGDAAGFAKKGD